MPDAIFADPRLAAVYDHLDGDRCDLAPYLAIAAEVRAASVLDIGCGTGTFACLLAGTGRTVVGLDPAAASIDVARHKPGADHVRWIVGDVRALPALQVDLVTMTGNVAQVFVTDDEWTATLRGSHASLREEGHLVFETRDPSRRAWRSWTRKRSSRRVEIPGEGTVLTWHEVTLVAPPLVSFRTHVIFERDGATLTSESTLRFRSRGEIVASLAHAGFAVAAIRDAPDRPGLEFVVIARRQAAP